LFLWGRALVMAGKQDEGRRRMEQSHWLPLGNEEARLDFSKALARRGLAEACRRENDLLLRLSQPASYYSGEAQRQVALDAQAKQDFLRSADGQERAMLRCLRTNVNFVQGAAYVGVPALIHRQRARGFLAVGKVGAALEEAAKCLDEQPGDVDVATLLVPELDKAGRRREADLLFNHVLAVYDAVCKDHPNCAWAHNSAAWLAACCGRDLDAGLARARKATELSPDVAGYQDTLAEVWFQRGDKDKAVAAQKKAVELDPKKTYYRKQLKRFEAGDRAAPRPSEDEDDEED
jgi:tetratricopeptide (TPR) repeat protein